MHLCKELPQLRWQSQRGSGESPPVPCLSCCNRQPVRTQGQTRQEEHLQITSSLLSSSPLWRNLGAAGAGPGSGLAVWPF